MDCRIQPILVTALLESFVEYKTFEKTGVYVTGFEKKPPSTHNYKYLEILILIMCCISRRKTDACMEFATIL